jgi:ubiquinone/menaquinone biosynthesis C-methylase UbiE
VNIESVIDREYTRSLDSRLDSQAAYVDYQIHEAQRAVPFLARFFGITNARVLELGAGSSGKGIAYAKAGMRVTSLDVDVPALRLGLNEARKRSVSVRFVGGDGTALPFPVSSFDAVLLDSVIEHVSDPLEVLRECHRVLRPGGIVFVVFPPFYGPLSGHIDDYVLIPWFHLLPRRMVKRKLLSLNQPRGILTPRIAYEVYATLNGLTIFRFKQIARRVGFKFDYLRVRPFLTHPGTRLAVGIVSALRSPLRIQNLRAVFTRARREFDFGTAALFVLLVLISPLVLVPFAQEVAVGGCKAVLRKS